MKNIIVLAIFILGLVGLADASYLTWEHYAEVLPPCSTNWWVDCGKVLTSPQSVLFGLPVAVWGVLQYLGIILTTGLLYQTWRQKLSWLLVVQTTLGFLFSLYFVGLQLFVIQAICLYCMLSALICTVIFALTMRLVNDKREMVLWMMSLTFQVLKRIFFLINPEIIHELMVNLGEFIGKVPVLPGVLRSFFNPTYPQLFQELAGVKLHTPIGLAAGFDCQAKLTEVLHAFGFGFQTVGTISNIPCEGNASPRLGRLPQSKSLLVNKGFRNPGIQAVTKKLADISFKNAVGISIGQTNTPVLKTRAAVLNDIISAFKHAEASSVQHSYYELNISCPNLQSSINFYNPKELEVLLTKLDALQLSHPVFVKMPISESDETVIALIEVITKHSPVGIIIGNLQKNRQDPSVVPSEQEGLGKGNLSGKPTFERSNHLIALAYKKFHKKLIIIGCGGISSADDAYLKITLGASALQLITGMVFEGPQLVAQINAGLVRRLQKEGYTHLRDAVGSQTMSYLKKASTKKR